MFTSTGLGVKIKNRNTDKNDWCPKQQIYFNSVISMSLSMKNTSRFLYWKPAPSSFCFSQFHSLCLLELGIANIYDIRHFQFLASSLAFSINSIIFKDKVSYIYAFHKSNDTTEGLIQCFDCFSHVFGMYLIRVWTTFWIANNAPPLGLRSTHCKNDKCSRLDRQMDDTDGWFRHYV